MHGKKATIKSSGVTESNIDIPPPIRFFDFREKVYNVVRLAEVILYIIILGRNTQLYKLILECPGLLKKAMYFTFDFHSCVIYLAAGAPGKLMYKLTIN